MKREEMEKLIAGYERAAETNPAHTDLIIHVTAFSLRELIALARLGASVAAPSEEELRIVGDAIDKAEWTDSCFDGDQTLYPELARAALLALKDRANV